MSRLDVIQEYCEAATPGPWTARLAEAKEELWGRFWEVGPMPVYLESPEVDWDVTFDYDDFWEESRKQACADARFIAAARSDLPLLLEIAEAAAAFSDWGGVDEAHEWDLLVRGQTSPRVHRAACRLCSLRAALAHLEGAER